MYTYTHTDFGLLSKFLLRFFCPCYTEEGGGPDKEAGTDSHDFCPQPHPHCV